MYGYEGHLLGGAETVSHQIVGIYGYKGHWPEGTETLQPSNSGNIWICWALP